MKPLRVLHLGANPASQLDVSVRALRDAGIDAAGLATSANAFASEEGIGVLPAVRPGIASGAHRLRRIAAVLPAIARADVVHWHSIPVLPAGLDLLAARLLRKRLIVEFWGSDIRVETIEAADNPAYAAALAEHPGVHRLTRARSFARQRSFARAGCDCILADPGMLPSLEPAAFRRVYRVRQRVMLEEYEPSPPGETARPRIVHAPSRRALKGTREVLAAIERLKARFDLEFRLVEGMSRAEAQRELRDADIFVDELVLGTYGLAALEAMAFAKPVVSYIKPSVRPEYPADLPIVAASGPELENALAELLGAPERRRELGLRGRAYVERHHDARKLALELVAAYREGL